MLAGLLHRALNERGLPVICVDARRAWAVLRQMPNKTDANDAAMLAELARSGFYRQVHVKSEEAQAMRTLLKAAPTGRGQRPLLSEADVSFWTSRGRRLHEGLAVSRSASRFLGEGRGRSCRRSGRTGSIHSRLSFASLQMACQRHADCRDRHSR